MAGTRLLKLFDVERVILKPPERIPPAEWTQSNRVLVQPSEIKGPLMLKMTPYNVPILNCVQDSQVETIVICKSAQLGLTEALISMVGYYCDQEPCPVMFCMADEDTATYMSRERIQRMFRASPKLAGLIIEPLFNQHEMSLANGAYIALAWASSVARLASRPIKVVLFDEVDKPGYSVTSNEASAISLGIQRTETFYNRKIVICSTPTDEHGNIWKHLNSCDAIFDWHVPCPYCGQLQPLRWAHEHCREFPEGRYRVDSGLWADIGQVKWEGGRNATPDQIAAAGYECGTCQALWSTAQKNKAVEQGVMVARKEIEHPPRKVGFHLNRLYSLLGRSGDIPKMVTEWIACFPDPRERQGFINSSLAEPLRQVIVASTESEILKARVDLPPQTAPDGAIALTCGIDVQKFGFWFVVRAWARDFSSWLIHYGFLASWDDVEALLESEYPQAGGGQPMKIWRCAVDSGGTDGDEGLTMTEQCYFWVRAHNTGRTYRLWATKGASSEIAGAVAKFGESRDLTPSGKPLRGGLQLVLVDSLKLKETVFARLESAVTGTQFQPAYLHKGVGADYPAQITAEEKRRDRRGKIEWVKIRRDNHLLDAECLCQALVDPTWPGGGLNLLRGPLNKSGQESAATQSAPPRQSDDGRPNWFKDPGAFRRSSWLNR
jgi:terminase, large subunit